MAERSRMRLAPGSMVVLEGLDRSGKSTQMRRLQRLPWLEPAPMFIHMPSGVARLTQSIYRLTETEPISSPLARQLLHLACHAENAKALSEAAADSGVVLDRWWWSTVAYGWYGAHLAGQGVEESAFFGMIDSVWLQHRADVVFLFLTPYQLDELNRDAVHDGYTRLAAQHPMLTVEVPIGTPDATADFITAHLIARGLLVEEA
ncbi:dTMP kinase [Pseudonocardia sp. DLS-67]